MGDWCLKFYNNVWHPYWTVPDLLIIIFILYQLRHLNHLIKNIQSNSKKDDTVNGSKSNN